MSQKRHITVRSIKYIIMNYTQCTDVSKLIAIVRIIRQHALFMYITYAFLLRLNSNKT